MVAPEDHLIYLQRHDFPLPSSVALTREERTILTKYGRWMEALSTGAIHAITPEQERFLLVDRGDAKPSTAHERAWDKLKRTSCRQAEAGQKVNDALAVLRGMLARGRILSSLADSLIRQADAGNALSPKQIACVHRLIQQAEERERNRPARVFTGQSRKYGSHRWSHLGS